MLSFFCCCWFPLFVFLLKRLFSLPTPPPSNMNCKFVFISFVTGSFSFIFTKWSSKPSSWFFYYCSWYSRMCYLLTHFLILISGALFYHSQIWRFSKWLNKPIFGFSIFNSDGKNISLLSRVKFISLKNYFKSLCDHSGERVVSNSGIQ